MLSAMIVEGEVACKVERRVWTVDYKHKFYTKKSNLQLCI